MIGQHKILCTLQVPHNFLQSSLLFLTRITKVSPKYTTHIGNIKICTYLNMHHTTNNERFRANFTYLIFLHHFEDIGL